MRTERLRAHLAAGQGNAVHVCGALIGADEDDARAVRAPARWQRLHLCAHVAHDDRADGAIPSGEQVGAAATAACGPEPEMDVLRCRPERLLDAETRDRLSARGPSRAAVL